MAVTRKAMLEMTRLVLGLTSLHLAICTPAFFPCGPGCTARIDPWCKDSLRIRMFRGETALDDAAGALGSPCKSMDAAVLGSQSLSNGAITGSWGDGVLRLTQSTTGHELLVSQGSVQQAFRMAPAVAPPPPPGPPRFACQDSCSLGTTGIREQTDARGCTLTASVHNVTRAGCCAACIARADCSAWSWGNEAADKAHRHNCYLCSSLTGTQHRASRDFGCVERTASSTRAATGRALNFTYYRISARFNSTPDEVIVGLGQRSKVPGGQTKLNQKGFSWPLGMTKYQISVPFYVSSRRYGFLWNAPGTGTVSVMDSVTSWNSTTQRQIDFWVTAAPAGPDPFGAIAARYADATGHAPLLPDFAMGFWQSKMRYRTSDELADVAAGFSRRGIPLSVLVIDFYSWSKFGDFHFDYRCWPNASDLVRYVAEQGNGTKVMHSTYPWVDQGSENYDLFASNGLLAREAATGQIARVSPAPGGAMLDPFLPETRQMVWDRVRAGYFDAGIEMFWLDDTEPNVKTDGLEYGCGRAEYCGALWPNRWVETFTQGLKRSGVSSPVILSRAGWAGFQTTGAVVWSSDIPSTFESLQIQVRAGLSIGMSGIPWWTTDVGGFVGADVTSPLFKELIVRWYQYGAFCPIFRTHGNRANEMAPLPSSGNRWHENGPECTMPNGHKSGGVNELWNFGTEVYPMLKAMIDLRESMRPYIQQLAQNVTTFGAPPMRPLFYDFPDDPKSFLVDDQFMFGYTYLVAPVLENGQRNRSIYFPIGSDWVHYFTSKRYSGGSTVVVAAPLAELPLFTRI